MHALAHCMFGGNEMFYSCFTRWAANTLGREKIYEIQQDLEHNALQNQQEFMNEIWVGITAFILQAGVIVRVKVRDRVRVRVRLELGLGLGFVGLTRPISYPDPNPDPNPTPQNVTNPPPELFISNPRAYAKLVKHAGGEILLYATEEDSDSTSNPHPKS